MIPFPINMNRVEEHREENLSILFELKKKEKKTEEDIKNWMNK